MDPKPLMIPVTVIKSLLPLMDGCSDRSTATAEVMMLMGPPMRHPMTTSMNNSKGVGSVFNGASSVPNSAKRSRKGMRVMVKVAMTHALRPPYRSEIRPTSMPPGSMPTSYRIDTRLLILGSND